MKRLLPLMIVCIIPFMIQAEDPEEGKVLFRNICKACHNIEINLVGPALKDVHKRRPTEWIVSFVQGSQKMVESGDSTAVTLFNQFNQIQMPDQPLSSEQIGNILSYIIQESEKEETVGLISRPIQPQKAILEPLHFSDFRFWIVYTITVVIIIGVLYYMVEITSIGKSIHHKE